MGFRTLLPAVFLALAGNGSVFAGEERPKGEDYEAGIRRLTQEIQILSLLNRLSPTRNQEESLLALATEARTLHEEYEKKAEACRLKMEKAFQALKTEDEADQGLSKAVQKAASKANNEYKDLQSTYKTRLTTLAGSVKALLTPEQIKGIEAFKPPVLDGGRIRPPGPARPRKRKKKASKEEQLLREIRTAHAGALARIEADLVRLQIEREEVKRGEAYSPTRKRAREAEIRLFFQRVRGLESELFEDRLPALCREIKPKTRIEELQAALKSASGGIPSPGRVAKYLLSPRTAELLERRLGRK
ncbi:MAG: hypothetical protein ACYS47_12925 [Planctomycetota bacterium]|jgi:hypothetical protein